MAQIPKTGTLYISDVKNALGETTTDLGRLCKSPKINPWAKYKPVRLANPFPDPNSDWWKGSDGNCGFSIPILSSPAEAVVKNWTYLPPSGGVESPYRLDDFRGYSDGVVPMMVHDYGTKLTINKFNYPSDIYQVAFSVSIPGQNSLSVFDFDASNLGDFYLTAQITRPGESEVGTLHSSENTISTGGSVVPIPINSLNGNYILRFFLSSVKYNGGTTVSGVCHPIPNNDIIPAEITLTIENRNPFLFLIDRISWDLNGAYVTVDELTPKMIGINKRLRTPGSVCLNGVISNSSGFAESIALSNLRINGMSFFSTSEMAPLSGVYGSNKQPLTGTLTIPAEGSVEVYVYCASMLNLHNGIATIPPVDSASDSDIRLSMMRPSGENLHLGGAYLPANYGNGGIIEIIAGPPEA